MKKRIVEKEDNRYIIFYTFTENERQKQDVQQDKGGYRDRVRKEEKICQN